MNPDDIIDENSFYLWGNDVTLDNISVYNLYASNCFGDKVKEHIKVENFGRIPGYRTYFELIDHTYFGD